MHFILSSSKYVIKMRYCQRIYWPISSGEFLGEKRASTWGSLLRFEPYYGSSVSASFPPVAQTHHYWALGQETRHPSENLVSYKGEVKGRVWSLSPFPRPPATSVDPRGAHPTHSSIRRMPGEDSGHQLACHFPLLPIAGLAPVGRATGKERAYEAVLLS
jgi:hypothetical protein